MKALIALTLVSLVLGQSDPYPQDPAGIPFEFICAWRSFAAEYAAILRPDAASEAIAAVQLPTLCNASAVLPRSRPRKSETLVVPAASGNTVFVDGVNGNDANPGTIQEPLKTVPAGVQKSRSLPAPVTVFLRAATYYLSSTLELNTQDSGLTLSSYNGEEVWISGAIPVPTPIAWEPFAISNASVQVSLSLHDA